MSTPPTPESLLRRLERKLPIQELAEIWQYRDEAAWALHPRLYLLVGKHLVSQGELILGHEVLSRGLEALFPQEVAVLRRGGTPPTPKDPLARDPSELPPDRLPLYAPMVQQLALALAQTGAVLDAQKVLLDLKERGFKDGETMGILGRTAKDLAFRKESPTDPVPGRANLLTAYRCYFEGMNQACQGLDRATDPERRKNLAGDARYNGINAATCAWFLKEDKTARALASKVLQLEAPADPDPWTLASQAEAHLLLWAMEDPRPPRPEEAERLYAAYVDKARGEHRNIATTRRQYERILDFLGVTGPTDLFPLPLVLAHVAYSTHPGGQCPEVCSHLGKDQEPYKTHRKGFDEELQGFPSLKVVATVSCPAEILFVEALLQWRDIQRVAGHSGLASLHLVLPCERAHVEETLDPYWSQRLALILGQATEVEELGQYHGTALSMAELRSFASVYARGLALLDADALGATSQTLETFATLTGSAGCDLKHRLVPTQAPVPDTRSKDAPHRFAWLSLLFSDIQNYSKLNDVQLEAFSAIYPDLVAGILKNWPESDIPVRRTQGDAVLLGFSTVQVALDVARALRDEVNRFPWTQKGLPWPLKARIALDAGPCSGYLDKVTGRQELCGQYVNRAARLEPITPPGHIFASRTFAALARLDGGVQEKVTFAGRRPLPKGFGDLVVYHVK